jgi:hypothetical protein
VVVVEVELVVKLSRGLAPRHGEGRWAKLHDVLIAARGAAKRLLLGEEPSVPIG